MKNFRVKMCASSALIAVIAYVLVGYYTKCWTWSLFIFLIVPLMPFLTGLKKITITYDLIVVIVYLVLGFTIKGWHPWWVLFLTIPIYHIFFDDVFKHRKKKKIIDVEVVDEDERK